MHIRLIPCQALKKQVAVPAAKAKLVWRMVLMVICVLLSAGSLPYLCRAADPVAPIDGATGETLQIDADRVSHDLNRNESTAEGNVTLTFRDLKLQADQVRYNRESLEAWAWGNVRLMSGRDILTGDRLSVDLAQETGTLGDGSVFIAENHVYLTAEEIHKTGPETYTANQATITTCDPPDPDWRITGKRVRVTLEGYGIAEHTAFWAGKVPLLYSPYFIFPAKTRRQSGLLLPEFAYSDRKGFEYRQPFFWAINDSSDATFHADIMSLRGVQLGAEYRYVLSPGSFGTVMLGGLNDNEVDDGSVDSGNRWGYPNDAFARPNSDRYWLRAKADQQLPGDVLAKLDLDMVSDQDYLHEFREGGFGFTATQEYFRETFGRDIDDEYDSIRFNQLNVNKTWRQFSANGDLRWYDNVVQRRQQETQDTLQQLPALQFSAVKQPLATLPIYYSLDSRYDYFFRQQGADAHRGDVYATMAFPVRLFNVLSVESTAGLRQTVWSAERDDELQTDQQEEQAYRSLHNFKVDINTEPYRIYQAGVAGGDRIKHIIKPQLIYQYLSDPDQSELPYFDADDRLAPQNTLTFALTNTLISRIVRKTAENKPPEYHYIPFLRFYLEESYDFSNGDARPFSDVLAELDLNPGRYIAIDADTTWSPYDYTFNRFNAALHLWNARADSLDLSYYTSSTSAGATGVQSLIIAGAVRLTDRWRLRARHEHNLETDTAIETGIGISYLSQCWSVDVDYIEESEDRSIALMIYLTGLGKISG